ncbi:hypothetical protein ACL02U_18665 [Streptomyces sp. MS06]|uniref:hypothetical protein n=1 Tax=Streptomyces sp. MS06 TaxID=3385974 RepID=UPI0039A09276
MFDAVVFGSVAVLCTVFGTWLVRRQRRRRADTLAGWGTLAFGAGQFFRAAAAPAGDRQPLDFVLTVCFAVLSVTGFVLVARSKGGSRYGGYGPRYGYGPRGGRGSRYGRGRRRRRKLPPIRP